MDWVAQRTCVGVCKVIIMADLSFELIVSATNYPRIRQALETMAGQKWYRGIVKDTATAALQDWALYAKKITHKLTGLLSESFVWEYDSHSQKGRLFINPRIVRRQGRNTLAWPHVYGVFEHDRGGSHAFFSRTMSARGSKVLEAGMRALISGVPKV